MSCLSSGGSRCDFGHRCRGESGCRRRSWAGCRRDRPCRCRACRPSYHHHPEHGAGNRATTDETRQYTKDAHGISSGHRYACTGAGAGRRGQAVEREGRQSTAACTAFQPQQRTSFGAPGGKAPKGPTKQEISQQNKKSANINIAYGSYHLSCTVS